MTRLRIVAKDGSELTVEAPDGLFVMEVLRPMDVGIAAAAKDRRPALLATSGSTANDQANFRKG